MPLEFQARRMSEGPTHDPARSERLDPFDNHIPYDWNVRQH